MNRIRLLKNTTDFTDFEDLLHDFLDYAQKYMDLKQVPEIEFVHDEHNGKDILGKTAQYDPNSMEIHVYSYGRHPKDMLRSIAHELVHHMQNEQGRLNVGGYHGQGYAQKNPALREIEKEAMLQSNLCLRDWEDGLKEQKRTIYKEWRNNNMSLKEWKNKELNTLLIEKWGFGSTEDPTSTPRRKKGHLGAGEVEVTGMGVKKMDRVTSEMYNNAVAKLRKDDALPELHPDKLNISNRRRAEAIVQAYKDTDYGRKQRVGADIPVSKNTVLPSSDPLAAVGEKGKGKGDLGHGDGVKGGEMEDDDEFDPAMEERLTKEIAAKMLQNESLLKKLRGK
jgi:hypothetical protein